MPTIASRNVSSRPPQRSWSDDGQRRPPPSPCSSRHESGSDSSQPDVSERRGAGGCRRSRARRRARPAAALTTSGSDRARAPGARRAPGRPTRSWPAASQIGQRPRAARPDVPAESPPSDREAEQAQPDPPRLVGRVLADQEQAQVVGDDAPAGLGQRPARRRRPATQPRWPPGPADESAMSRAAAGTGSRAASRCGPTLAGRRRQARRRSLGRTGASRRRSSLQHLDAPVVEVHEQRRDEADGEVGRPSRGR